MTKPAATQGLLWIAYGTRPEIIRLFPIIHELTRRGLPFRTVFTGQHFDLYHDVKQLVPPPDIRFPDRCGNARTLARSLLAIGAAADTWIEEHQPALVMVQGDTTTAWALAQVAYCHQVGVAHVEAGLRTGDLCNPYPEEANRRLISVVADWNFAPTRRAAETLRREGARNVILTGNTIVDAIRGFGFQTTAGNTVPITIHRRENHRQLPRICAQLNAVAARCPELEFVFPMHPNPNVQQHRALLTAPNLRVIAPVDYPTMLRMISQARFLITDSGGLQEEALCFRKKVLVVRKVSERPETIEAGFGRLVDADIESGLDWALAPAAATADNPYGDGHSAARIVDALAPVIGAP